MSEFFKHMMANSFLLECLPFLIINRNGDGKIGVDTGELVKALITAGIIALVVGYGTVRVMEKEQEWIKAELKGINEKLDRLVPDVQSIKSERTVRRAEIDRRLDQLERKK